MKTLVVGFPYVRESFFAVFRHWPDPDAIRFLLPEHWPIKGGASEYRPAKDPRVTTARAYFANYRWKYPVIGGLLKGWMPAFPVFLWSERARTDVVYACSEPILLVTLYYAFWTRLMNKKLIFFTWENIPYEQKLQGFSRFVHEVLLWLNLRLAHGLMCGNEASAAIHRRYTRKPVAVIPMNGVDPERFRRSEPRDPQVSSRVVYAFVGAIGKRKGIQHIIEALPDVLQTVPDAHLIIAGSGEYEREIERLTNEPFLRGRITRFPWLSHQEVIRLLSSADVFVYPSIAHGGWAEQFGYSMAEASLMELPVISTRSGSIPDVVRDEETGILVPPGDVPALVAAMVRLGTDAQLRRRMGKAGRVYIMGRYSNERVARRMHAFLSSV